MPFGMGPWGWYTAPHSYWGWGRCRWFPWLPRWWWTGIYGSISPWTAPYGMPAIPKEQEIAMLEDEVKLLEQQLQEAKRRLKELRG